MESLWLYCMFTTLFFNMHENYEVFCSYCFIYKPFILYFPWQVPYFHFQLPITDSVWCVWFDVDSTFDCFSRFQNFQKEINPSVLSFAEIFSDIFLTLKNSFTIHKQQSVLQTNVVKTVTIMCFNCVNGNILYFERLP